MGLDFKPYPFWTCFFPRQHRISFHVNIGHVDTDYEWKLLSDLGPFYEHGVTLIPSRISKQTPNKDWVGTTYPFSNFNGVVITMSSHTVVPSSPAKGILGMDTYFQLTLHNRRNYYLFMPGLKLNHFDKSGVCFPELYKLCLPASMDK